MPYAIDPATGLPVDEHGNIVDPSAAGSDVVSEFNPPYIDMGEPEYIEMPPEEMRPAPEIEMAPEWVGGHPNEPVNLGQEPPYIDFESDSVPAAPSTPTSTGSRSASRSQSFRGMTNAGLKKSGDLFDRELAKVNPEIDRLGRQADADKLKAQEAYGRHRDAIFEIGDQTRQYYERESELQNRLSDIHETAAQMEQQAAAESKAERAQYTSAYKEQLAGVKALAMQSGNPYAQMSGGEALGLAAAHFAQGFLAARGVQIDVAGQVDRWVDRSIREHQQKIQNMREGAQDQLHLYEIARQTSQDDWEARQRVRGFMIEGLKQRIVTEASRFNSSIANAKAQEAVAKLDIEAQATEMAIGQRFEQQQFQQKQQAIQIAQHKGSLAVQWYSAQTARKEAEARVAAAKAKKDEKAWSSKIADPFDVKKDKDGKAISGGKYKWAVDTHAPDGIQSKAAEAATNVSAYYSEMRTGLDRLRELRVAAKAAMKGPDSYRALTSQAYREYEAQKNYLTELTQQKITGAAAPEEQAKRIRKWLADDNLLEEGSNEKLLEGFNESLRQKYESTMNSIVGMKKLSDADVPEEERYEQVAPTADPDRKLLYDAGKRSELKTSAAASEAMVVGGDHNEGTHDPSPMYYGYLKSKGAKSNSISGGAVFRMANEMKAIDQLGIALVRPETLITQTVDGAPAEDAEHIRAEATQLLADIASGKPLSTGRPADKEVQEYARHVIESGKQMSWDADAFYLRLASSVTPDNGQDERPPDPRAIDEWQSKMTGE